MMTALEERWGYLKEWIHRRIDGWTHSAARRSAQERLRKRQPPSRILVICTGNICRSPYAASVLRTAVGAGARTIEVDSAGFLGPDRPADPRGSAIALSRGVDLSSHRSRLVQPEDATRFDLLIVMTHKHRDQLIDRIGAPEDRIFLLGDFDPDDPPHREIADPYGKPDEAFVTAFGQIERSISGLCECLPGQAS